MRLPRDPELPAGLKTLSRLQFIHGFVVVAVATAIWLFPALEDASFVGARAGVRPGSPDGIPIMGPLPGWDGVSIACGHDHVGVMLSPGSAELAARYVLDGDPRPLEAFSISRFDAPASQ